jgi:hypothetical protein
MSEDAPTPDLVEMTRELSEADSVHATIHCYRADAVYDLSDTGMGVFEGRAAIRAFLDERPRRWSWSRRDDRLPLLRRHPETTRPRTETRAELARGAGRNIAVKVRR